MAAGRLTSSEAISTRFFSLRLQQQAELGGGGGLARTLQADHQDRRGRRAERERGILRAQGFDQHVMDDLDDLLAGRDRADDIFADGARADLVDEVLHHRQRHIGVDQGGAHFGQGGIDIGFAERAAPAELVEDAAEAGLQTFKQGIANSKQLRPRGRTALPGGDPRRRAGTGKA